jgi:16S rRNA (uracil1498-N3)-methyltransferase
MSAPHFFAADVSGDRVTLDGDEARHASRVLRVRPGEVVTVADGDGNVVRATVEEAGSRLVAVVTDRWADPPAVPSIHVFPAIPKAGKLDLVVQKLTELGVDVIQPFPAARSVSRWNETKATAQTERLASIAHEASKQSRRSRLPEIRPPAPPTSLELPGCTLVLDEEAEDRLLGALPVEAPAGIGLVIGPEGGLERDEIRVFQGRGARAVSLGPLMLRTETASLAATAVVAARYGRLG